MSEYDEDSFEATFTAAMNESDANGDPGSPEAPEEPVSVEGATQGSEEPQVDPQAAPEPDGEWKPPSETAWNQHQRRFDAVASERESLRRELAASQANWARFQDEWAQATSALDEAIAKDAELAGKNGSPGESGEDGPKDPVTAISDTISHALSQQLDRRLGPIEQHFQGQQLAGQEAARLASLQSFAAQEMETYAVENPEFAGKVQAFVNAEVRRQMAVQGVPQDVAMRTVSAFVDSVAENCMRTGQSFGATLNGVIDAGYGGLMSRPAMAAQPPQTSGALRERRMAQEGDVNLGQVQGQTPEVSPDMSEMDGAEVARAFEMLEANGDMDLEGAYRKVLEQRA